MTAMAEKSQHRHDAKRNAAANLDRRRADVAGAQEFAIGGESFEQSVLDNDRDPECHEQWRQNIPPQSAIENDELQRKSNHKHQRQGDQRRDKWIDSEP